MKSAREFLAEYIVERYCDDISGRNEKIIINKNPEDIAYVGKLSPISEGSSFSSNVLIKQISVDFKISVDDVKKTKLLIKPRGSFFMRILPTYEQQVAAFLKELNNLTLKSFNNIDEAFRFYKDNNNTFLEDEQVGDKEFKVSLLPVFEKVSLEDVDTEFVVDLNSIYDEEIGIGFTTSLNSTIDKDIMEHLDKLEDICQNNEMVMKSAIRNKLTIHDIVTLESWQKYVNRSRKSEFDSFQKWNYAIGVNLKNVADDVFVTVSFSNETDYSDPNVSSKDSLEKRFRISTIFNSGIHVNVNGADLKPIVLDYFEDDYKYDKNVYALGNNCNIINSDEKNIIETTHLPIYIQKRLKTNDSISIKFCDLVINPVENLMKVVKAMDKERLGWVEDYDRKKDNLTTKGKEQFKNELRDFDLEIKRFKTGIELIKEYQIIKDAFIYMNQTFINSSNGKYDSWRLFQIVFIVSLILDLVAEEPMLELEDEIKNKSKLDFLDVLYFPTGGGKTEAFLGVLIFNLFFDRIRGKNKGMTAILKYPLRLLSIQQVQRVANLLAAAEQIRKEKIEGVGVFTLGYYVGDANTPNDLDDKAVELIAGKTQEQRDKEYKILDVCPYCRRDSLHVVIDEKQKRLMHKCSNEDCKSNGLIPIYMVDTEIYRYIPSVIISTVDKMAAIGSNSNFQNLINGASKFCPEHGYTNKAKCIAKGCAVPVEQHRDVVFKDPAPSLIIQDELHLIRESLGSYAAHYETLVDHFAREISSSKRGIKVIGASATISGMQQQARHLFMKNAIRFPCASPYVDKNFYAAIDHNEVCRIILGYAPFGKAIINSVAYSLQYMRKIVWDIYNNPPESLIENENIPWGVESREEKIMIFKEIMMDYWIVIEYNNVKMDSNNVMNAIEDPINTQLVDMNIGKIVPRKMTGDDSFQDVRTVLSAIENTSNVVNDLDFNMITATSMISHGVDADRFNVMFFYGMPGNTAEYIQAYSRVGRRHVGIVIDIMRPAREKDQSYLKNFVKFHEYKDILVETVPINRWATRAVEVTFPGMVSALIINHYNNEFQFEYGNIFMMNNLKKCLIDGKITEDEIRDHMYKIYHCLKDDNAIGTQYRIKIDELVAILFERIKTTIFNKDCYIIEGFDKIKFHIMRSLRDTEESLIVELK